MHSEHIAFYSLLVNSATAVFLALIALGSLFLNRKQDHMGGKIDTLEKNTNSIKDELVRTTKAASYAAGILEQKRRADENAPDAKEIPEAIVNAATAVKEAAHAVAAPAKEKKR